MKSLGLDPETYLANNDASAFFAATGDLLLTGPTLTNVNDIRVILVDPKSQPLQQASLARFLHANRRHFARKRYPALGLRLANPKEPA